MASNNVSLKEQINRLSENLAILQESDNTHQIIDGETTHAYLSLEDVDCNRLNNAPQYDFMQN